MASRMGWPRTEIASLTFQQKSPSWISDKSVAVMSPRNADRRTRRSSGVGAMPETWQVASTHASSYERSSLAPRAVTWPSVSARLCSLPLAVSNASLSVPELRTAPALSVVNASSGKSSPSTREAGIFKSTLADSSGFFKISRTIEAI